MFKKKYKTFPKAVGKSLKIFVCKTSAHSAVAKGQSLDNKRVEETAARGISGRCNRTDTSMLQLQIITPCI